MLDLLLYILFVIAASVGLSAAMLVVVFFVVMVNDLVNG